MRPSEIRAPDDLVELVFRERPPSETVAELKAAGFRPRKGHPEVWTRKRCPAALVFAGRLAR